MSGKDITLSILRDFFEQEYETAKVSRIARCVRMNEIYKNPDELLTDHFWMPLRDLCKMGYLGYDEYRKRIRRQRELLNNQILLSLRMKFEYDTLEEARRRKRTACNSTVVI